jgi:hypothetical protein
MASSFSIEPVEDQNYEGRQWGYRILRDGVEFLRATAGGTGACWNIGDLGGDPDMVATHICDLDEWIAALTALRNSAANAIHRERWGVANYNEFLDERRNG